MTQNALTVPSPTTTITTNHPPATPPCGLNPDRICREESDTPQKQRQSEWWEQQTQPRVDKLIDDARKRWPHSPAA